MQNETSIPESLQGLTFKFFDEAYSYQLRKILESSQVNSSFEKGSLENYFIISGIVLTNPQQNCKVSFKKTVDNPEGEVKSKCSCSQWSEEKHCVHTAALFTYFILKELVQNSGALHDQQADEYSSQGVFPNKYGTIIFSANHLRGAGFNSTFSTLQYRLTNESIVNFPLPEKFPGKVLISLTRAHLEESPEHLNFKDFYIPIFSFFINDQIHQSVSLLGYSFLFDWSTGQAYHMPEYCKTWIKSFKAHSSFLPPHDILRILANQQLDHLWLNSNNKPLALDQVEELDIKVIISPSSVNHLSISLELIYNEEKMQLSSPFDLLAYEGGKLTSFKTKNDAQTFFESWNQSSKNNNLSFNKNLYSCSEKDYYNDWFSYLLLNDWIIFYQKDLSLYYKLSCQKFNIILNTLIEEFSGAFTKRSLIDQAKSRISFEMASPLVMEKMLQIYNKFKSQNIEIYYSNKKVAMWTSQVQFERDQTQKINWFNLNMKLTEEEYQMLQNFDLNQNSIVVDEQMILIDQDQKNILSFLKKYADEKDSSLKDDQGQMTINLSLKRARIFELFELYKHGITGALTKEELKICHNLQNLQELPSYPVTPYYQDILRSYQTTGYQWLRFLFENKFGACLADDMGLGKTLQTIAFIDSIIDRINCVLIVCPVSILLNWENEIKKFSKLSCHLYYGGEREFLTDHKIILTSYGILKKEYSTVFANHKFDILIFDEIQKLKNIRSIGARAARLLNADFKIGLTGTPVENDLSEFYNILDICIPGVWGEMKLSKSNSQKENRYRAKRIVKPFILRRTKDQVLKDLPDKNENYVYLNFSEDEKLNYVKTHQQIQDEIQNANQKSRYGEVLKSLLKLRQLCLWQNIDQLRSTKIKFLMENLEQIIEEQHQCIIFSQFTTYLDHIEEAIKKRNWKFSRIDGSMNMNKRQSEVDAFQNSKVPIFLISLKAGGFGLNLTAASYIFIMDPWWNPAVENQAIDRAHRIGQENILTVYRPIIKDSIEEKVLVLQESKRELFKDLMEGDQDQAFSGKLTMEDFQHLLS